MGKGAAAQDHLQGDLQIRRGGDQQVTNLKIGVCGETDGAVILLVGVKSIVPEEQVGLKLRHQGQVPAHLFQVMRIGILAPVEAVDVDIDFMAALGLVIDSTKTEQEGFRVLPEQLAGAVGMMGVGVHNGQTSDPADLPGVVQGDDHVVEAAGAPELAVAGVMAAGADEAEGPVDHALGQGLHARHHRAHRLVSRGAEAVPGHHLQHRRVVHLENELLGNPRRLKQPHVRLLQHGLQGLGKIPQPVADGHVALAAEGGMVEDADVFHIFNNYFKIYINIFSLKDYK